jgi:hypothetical protein
MSANNGSYFGTSWGWEAMVLFGVSITGLIFMVSVRIFGLQGLFALAVAAFVTWVALSTLWSESLPGSVREVERDIVYVGLGLALAVFGRYLTSRGLVLGLLAGITGVLGYSLATRLFPNHFAPPDPTWGYRLAAPLGYWNALGLFAAMGLILAAAVAAHSGSRTLRMAAGAATCVMAPAMLFTFSRGAWVAAAIGLAAMIALDGRRIELVASSVALAVPVVILVWVGATSHALTTANTSIAAQIHAGDRYAVAVVVFACITAAVVELAHLGMARFDPSPRAERRFAYGLLGGCVVLFLALLFAVGGPTRAYDRGLSAFRRGLNTPTGGSLSHRLGSLSNHGRIDHWRVAIQDYRQHPVLGSGAGTYEQVWYVERHIDVVVRDAHSLYLEVLGEMGIVGLALVLLIVSIPIAGCFQARSSPFVPAAGGAFAAFAAHAGIDWDWEVVALTSTAMVAGSAGLIAAGEGRRILTLARPARIGLAAAGALIAVFAFVSFVGNREVASSKTALAKGNTVAAVQDAQRAGDVLRWSIEPALALAQAQEQRGDLTAARAALEDATRRDPGNWRAWAALSYITSGRARHHAQVRAHALNPIDVPAPPG